MRITSTVATIIQVVSPLLGRGTTGTATAANKTPLKASAVSASKIVIIFFIIFSFLEGILTGFASADTYHLFQVEDKNLAVANFACAGRFLNGLNDLI